MTLRLSPGSGKVTLAKPTGASWLITPQEKVLAPETINSVVAWWDASHAASFTYSSGTSVSAWASRTGSYTLVQNNSAKQPERNGTVNGLSTVVFNGSSDALSVASFDLTPGGQKFSVWAVFSASAGSDRIIAEHSNNYNFTSGAFIFFRTATNKVDLTKYGGISAVNYAGFASNDTLTTTPKVVIGVHDGTLSSDETLLKLNGSGAGTQLLNANTNANNISSTLNVGARAGTSVYLNGQICELGFTTSALTDDEIGRLESYLSRKWGIAF